MAHHKVDHRKTHHSESVAQHDSKPEPFSLRGFLKTLGPGLITGASDDDPSGIGTYSQAGAQLGYSVGWTMLLTFPLMVAIQDISARVGRVTGLGIAGNVCRHYPVWVLNIIVALLFIATSLMFFLMYEWLHLAYHIPEGTRLGRNPLIAKLRSLHQRHHDPRLMKRWNFNVTVPLFDWLHGTLWSPARAAPTGRRRPAPGASELADR